jgi:maleylpyruvate isomerase
MKLYSYWRSSASWRVRIALAYKNIPYEYIPVHLVKDGGQQHSADYRTLNPMEQVPTLILDHGLRLSQSMAILEYLEETVPQPALLPSDPYARGVARQLAELVNSGIQPFQNHATTGELTNLGVEPKGFVRTFIARGLAALAASAQSSAGQFLVGDAPTFADVCLVPQLNAARRHEVDLGEWPLLVRVEEACNQLPSFQAAHADRQPDAGG